MGRAPIHGRLQPIEIGIGDDGQIVAVGKDLRGVRRHEVGESVILASGIDLHAHFRDPGPPDAGEDFASGTLQAALGGIGAAVDMPNNPEPTTTVERLATKRARARSRLAVDLVLFAALTDPTRVPSLAREAGGFKLYLSPTTGIDTPPPIEGLNALLQAIPPTRLPLSVHAEDPARFVALRKLDSTEAWNAARPPESERDAVDRLLTGPAALRLHVAHVTLPDVAERLRNVGQCFEATPQHLLLSARPGLGSRGKVNPPLRDAVTQSALWELFRSGQIPCVASDHSPHGADAKARPFNEAPSGMPGIETLLPLLLERVRTGELGLEVLNRAVADRPARLLGLPQGRLAPGHRANLLVVDFRSHDPLRASRLHSPGGWTAYEGWEAVLPREHYLDGRRIVEDGEYVGAREGRIVRPEFAPGARGPN